MRKRGRQGSAWEIVCAERYRRKDNKLAERLKEIDESEMKWGDNTQNALNYCLLLCAIRSGAVFSNHR